MGIKMSRGNNNKKGASKDGCMAFRCFGRW